MANLVVDIGNSRTKVAVFDDRQLVYSGSFTEVAPDLLDALFSAHPVSHSILSSVAGSAETLETFLAERSAYMRFSAERSSGITLNYRTPQTLGLDRLAGVIGAANLHPNQNCLVVDAGTCITYDFVDQERTYYGGSISPGINMRFRALNTYTGKLPLLAQDEEFTGWAGDDTRTSILSGVVEGAFLEVQGFIQRYNSKYSGLQVVLCGGDAKLFDTRLKNSIFAHSVKTEPHLVLRGLNEVIHHYND